MYTGVGREGWVKRIRPRNIIFCNCFHIPLIIKQQQSWMERCYGNHYCYCKATARKLGQTFFHSEPNDGEDKVIFYTITCSFFYRVCAGSRVTRCPDFIRTVPIFGSFFSYRLLLPPTPVSIFHTCCLVILAGSHAQTLSPTPILSCLLWSPPFQEFSDFKNRLWQKYKYSKSICICNSIETI